MSTHMDMHTRYTHGESVRHAAGAEATSVNSQLPVRDKRRTWGVGMGGPPAWPAWQATLCICPSSLGQPLQSAVFQNSLGTLPHPQGLVLFTGME